MNTPNQTGKSSPPIPPVHILCRALNRIRPQCITVLTYHRIAPDNLPNTPGKHLGISATKSNFCKHLQLLKNSTNVIPASQLASWIRGESSLPPNASIITFDDGYRDNMTQALPLLQKLNLPAIIYLCTDNIGSQTPQYWDLAIYGFQKATHKTYTLPIIGTVQLCSKNINKICRRWIYAVKALSTAQRKQATDELIQVLNVIVPADAFKDLYLSWDEVRSMQRSGIEFGAHTVTHPILSTLPDDIAQQEIINSKLKIESELKTPVTSFAFPNGLPGDYNDQHITTLRNAEFDMAFTLSPGPTTRTTVKKNPYKIRRIYIGIKDSPMRFALKLCGATRIYKQSAP